MPPVLSMPMTSVGSPSVGRKVKQLSQRVAAVRVLQQVIEGQQSLTTALPAVLVQLQPEQRGLVQELCYGTLRWYLQLETLLSQLLQKPLKRKDHDLQLLMLVGIYQLQHMEIPDYAVLSETVQGAMALRKQWAKGLVNGVLRGFQRDQQKLQDTLQYDPVALYAHPQWLINRLQLGWPEQWQQLLEANNQRPPLTLRTNSSYQSREALAQQLDERGLGYQLSPHAIDAITLDHPVAVEQIPTFMEGGASVQDGAAQLAARLLAPHNGERLLDACAAPGGKSCHLLELAPEAQLTALDSDPKRLQRVEENLQRLGLRATVIAGDASKPDAWWDGELFDAILLDAPCSATGVIRRHPDIKQLRRPDDIEPLVTLQQQILLALWPLLRPGGRLLYATCSMLPVENRDQIERFCAAHPDATPQPIEGEWGIPSGHGRQCLTGRDGLDGFFYALLVKG